MFAKHWRAEILLPLRPGSLKHKNPQRHKIICGMCPVGCKDRLSNLKMFLYNIPFCVISVAVLVAFVKQLLFLLVFVVLYNRRSIFINSVNCNTEFWGLSSV